MGRWELNFYSKGAAERPFPDWENLSGKSPGGILGIKTNTFQSSRDTHQVAKGS